MKEALFAGIKKAAEAVMEVRRVEGKSLLEDITGRFAACKASMDEIERLHPKVMAAQKQRVLEVTAQVEGGDEQAKLVLDDLYGALNKLDVAEEITRFRSHREAALEVLTSKSIEKGKRLDFMLQELLRETNTIASKCSNYDISKQAVEIKVELEKAREQVQNVV